MDKPISSRASRVARGLFRTLLALTVSVAAAAAAYADGLPQRIIVKYRTALTTNELATNAARAMSNVTARYDVSMRDVRRMHNGAHVMTLDREMTDRDYNQLVKDIAANGDVEYAEADRMMKATFTPNDTYYNLQWHYYETAGSINVPTAWDLSTGRGVTVAVIDTGYRPHVDLAANIVGGYDFISDTFVSRDGNLRDNDARDPGDWNAAGECGAGTPASNSSRHGTHVAGVAALMLAVNPSLTPAQVETTLRNTTRAFPATCRECGTGIVNARAAVVAAQNAAR
jgi:serine protease